MTAKGTNFYATENLGLSPTYTPPGSPWNFTNSWVAFRLMPKWGPDHGTTQHRQQWLGRVGVGGGASTAQLGRSPCRASPPPIGPFFNSIFFCFLAIGAPMCTDVHLRVSSVHPRYRWLINGLKFILKTTTKINGAEAKTTKIRGGVGGATSARGGSETEI